MGVHVEAIVALIEGVLLVLVVSLDVALFPGGFHTFHSLFTFKDVPLTILNVLLGKLFALFSGNLLLLEFLLATGGVLGHIENKPIDFLVDDELSVLDDILVRDVEFGLQGASEEDEVGEQKFLEHICDYK